MPNLIVTEVLSYSEWSMATYWSQDHQQYEIIFASNFSRKKLGERKELISVEQNGCVYSPEDKIWKEVEESLEKQKAPVGARNSQQRHNTITQLSEI